MYQIYVRQSIEAGIKDSDEGRTVDMKEVRKRLIRHFYLKCKIEVLAQN